MKNASTFSGEWVTHRHGADAEFLALVEQLGIDSGAMVHPRTELIFAMARRDCGKCTSKENCRQALRQSAVTLSEIARFCASTDVVVDLLRRQPYGPSFNERGITASA